MCVLLRDGAGFVVLPYGVHDGDARRIGFVTDLLLSDRWEADGVSALDDAADALLASRAADGDELAFAVIVRRHAPFLRAFATGLLRSTADVDDVVQESFITAWDKLPELRDPQQLRSWLTTVTARKATDRLRRRTASVPLDDVDAPGDQPGPEQTAELSSQMAALSAALADLPDDVRVTWTLREVSGASYEEIAAELDVPVSTVRGRLARARAHLLERMMEWRTS
jgi:RNA polymerase sigma-70 factor, ECF subfamily